MILGVILNSTKYGVMSSKAKSAIEPPKPGSNAFHWFNYHEKVTLGDKYDYQKTLAKWRKMDSKAKDAYHEAAYEAPRHRAKPGAKRGVSAYDVLRKDLRDLMKIDKKLAAKNLNMTTLASNIRKHLAEKSRAWGNNGEKWLTTPTEDHFTAIRRAIKLNPDFVK